MLVRVLGCEKTRLPERVATSTVGVLAEARVRDPLVVDVVVACCWPVDGLNRCCPIAPVSGTQAIEHTANINLALKRRIDFSLSKNASQSELESAATGKVIGIKTACSLIKVELIGK